MAEPLKNQFDVAVIDTIAEALSIAAQRRHVDFDRAGFRRDCVAGFDELELTPRARHIAAAMAAHLPDDRGEAIALLLESLGPELEDTAEMGMAPFRYLPHVYFVAEEGQGDFEAAMQLQYELTKRFTAEVSIRSYLHGAHRDATMARLHEWVDDPSEHVRRLVSEGTRPRLPWAGRLAEFVNDPRPVLELLERLRHDPSEYVRRSVANNLNDIAKDHPATVVATCRRWWAEVDHAAAAAGDEQATRERWMIRHGLRTLIKQGDADALDVLGFGASSAARLATASVEPGDPSIGDKVRIELVVENPSSDPAGALVDVRVHFVKANGTTSPKVFKGAELELAPGGSAPVRKTVSLAQHSTRTHHAGVHRVEALINGVSVDAGSFTLHP